MNITGYKYENENDAIQARQECATFYGLPKPNGTTLYWVDYSFAELNNPQFWYIRYDESIQQILGKPTEFDVQFNEPIV